MAIIRLKRIATEFKSSDHKLLPGELGITGKSLLYGSMYENLDTNGKVLARQVATQNFDNLFTAENIFKSEEKSISLQNEAGTEMYKVHAGRLIASRPSGFSFNDHDLVDRKYVDDNIKAADALILKGTVNAETGFITSSDEAINLTSLKGSSNLLTNYLVGWTFKVDTAGTLTNIGTLQVGDMVVVMNNYGSMFMPSDFHAFQTNVEFTTIGSNLAKVPDVSEISFIKINANETVSTLNATNFKTALSLTYSDIGGTRPFPEKNHSHSGLNITHDGINKDFILSIDEASENLGAPSFSLVDGTSLVLKGQDYSNRFQFETSRAQFTFDKDLYINQKKVLTEGDGHTHSDLILEKTSSDAGQASLSLFQEIDGGTGTTVKNGIRFFNQAFGSGKYLEIAKTSSGAIEFNSDGPIYFDEPIEATIDCGTSW